MLHPNSTFSKLWFTINFLPSNQDEGAQLLLDAGADVNCKNALGVVPISLATMMGNSRVLKVLANSPQADLCHQVPTCTITSMYTRTNYIQDLIKSATKPMELCTS